jgi:hypothetical protein
VRLRVFDLNTPWFWFTVFYEPKWGEPYLVASLWQPHKWQKFWIHFWKWEKAPIPGGYEAMPVSQSDAKPQST